VPRNIFLIFIGTLFLIADQAIKFFLIHSLKANETIPVIKNIFHITLIFNTGCAFGLLKDQPSLFFLIISLTAIILLIYFFSRFKDGDVFYKLAAILLIAGSASNLIDRLRFGYVVDFLDFRIWPVFNLGDSAITIGVILFMYLLLRSKKSKVKR